MKLREQISVILFLGFSLLLHIGRRQCQVCCVSLSLMILRHTEVRCDIFCEIRLHELLQEHIQNRIRGVTKPFYERRFMHNLRLVKCKITTPYFSHFFHCLLGNIEHNFLI